MAAILVRVEESVRRAFKLVCVDEGVSMSDKLTEFIVGVVDGVELVRKGPSIPERKSVLPVPVPPLNE